METLEKKAHFEHEHKFWELVRVRYNDPKDYSKVSKRNDELNRQKLKRRKEEKKALLFMGIE